MRLDGRLLFLFVVVSLILGRVISLSSRRAVHAVLTAKLEASARARAPEIARSMAVGLKPRGGRLLESYLRGTLGAFGASTAAAVDARGFVVASDSVGRAPSVAGTKVEGWSGSGIRSRETEAWGHPTLELLVPAEDASGSLVLGFDLEDALRTEDEIALKIFLFAGLSGGLGLLLLFLLMRDLVRRFDRMSADVLEHMHDGVFVVDEGGRLRTVNPSLLRMLGYREEELIGRPASSLLSPGAGPIGAPLENAELQLLRKDGGSVPVLLSVSLLRAGGGAPTGIVCAVRDVTELRRKDAALKAREEALRQADKLSAVGRLAAGLAHEINNPLGSILGFAQAAAARVKPSEALAVPLRGIEEEALRCKGLVQSLLSFSRQGRGAGEPFDLAGAVDGTLAMIEAQARVKDVEISREISPARLTGDRGQIQQVVMNLCTNAIDAMPGGGRLTVRCGERPGGVFIEVQDEGDGVPEDIRGRIFDPFFTTKDVGQGTGLGLSLVHEIVTRHRGTVEVASAPFRGALFRVALPAA